MIQYLSKQNRVKTVRIYGCKRGNYPRQRTRCIRSYVYFVPRTVCVKQSSPIKGALIANGVPLFLRARLRTSSNVPAYSTVYPRYYFPLRRSPSIVGERACTLFPILVPFLLYAPSSMLASSLWPSPIKLLHGRGRLLYPGLHSVS